MNNQEINDTVLKALGWEIKEVEDDPYGWYVLWEVTKPNGTTTYWNIEDKEMELPDYANDLRWAMDLLLVHLVPPSAKFEIVTDSVGYVWVNISWADKSAEGFTTDAVSNLAQLICMVWLRWIDKDVFDTNVKVISL